MNALDAFYHTAHDAKGGLESLAARLNMSAQVLRNKANPNNVANKPLLEDADRMMGLTGDYRILDALAAGHGRIVIKAPEPGESCDAAILELIAHSWKTNGEVGMAVHEILSDGKVESHELPKVRTAIYHTMQSLNEMLMRLEGMAQ